MKKDKGYAKFRGGNVCYWGDVKKVDVVAWDSCALSGTRNSKRENWCLIEIEELRKPR